MRKAEQLKQILREMLQSDPVLSGTVTAVSESKRTCTVKLDNGLVLYNVMLTATKEATKGVVVIPANKSNVQIIAISDVDFLLIATDEVKKVLWDVDGNKLEMRKDLFQIGEGKNGGIPITSKTAKRLNKIEAQQNKILSILKGTIIPLAPSGTYPFASLYASLTPLVQTLESDIENTKAKH